MLRFAAKMLAARIWERLRGRYRATPNSPDRAAFRWKGRYHVYMAPMGVASWRAAFRHLNGGLGWVAIRAACCSAGAAMKMTFFEHSLGWLSREGSYGRSLGRPCARAGGEQASLTGF